MKRSSHIKRGDLFSIWRQNPYCMVKLNSNRAEPVFPNRIYQLLLVFLIATIASSPLMFTNLRDVLGEDIFNSIIFGVMGGVTLLVFYLVNRVRVVSNPINIRLVNVQLMSLSVIFISLFHVGVVPVINAYLSPTIGPLFGIDANASNPTTLAIPMLLGAIVLGPIFEELIFRQYFLNGLLGRHKPLAAILISSVLFGLVHVLPMQVWPGIIFGMLFGFVFLKTKSLGNVILLHGFANALSLLVANTRNTLEYRWLEGVYTDYPVVLLIVCLASLFVVSKKLYSVTPITVLK